jgi:DNA primase
VIAEMHTEYIFNPGGEELQKIFIYYGIELDDQIVCPFHNDHRPSCHIDFINGRFHCFACEAKGNAFNFVQLANSKLSDLKQLLLYHAILNSSKVSKIKIPKINKSVKSGKDLYTPEDELFLAHDYYYGLKSVNWHDVQSEYKDYMINRGFTSKTLNLIKAKLTITNNKYPLIFPIMDNGEFKGYVCRTTDKQTEKDRKYLYNKGFSRNNTLGGDYKNKVVVLCEGYMDMLKLKQFGLKNVAAIFGWKITSKQIEKLRAAGVKTIISALDMDKPGRDGTDYLKNFFNVIEFQFPKGVKDPGELNKKQYNLAYKKTKLLFRKGR